MSTASSSIASFHTILPPVELREYIQFFWVLEGSATAQKPFYHRVLAESSPEWIFYCKGQFEQLDEGPERLKTPVSCLCGQMQHFKRLFTVKDFTLFGVYLFPYSVPHILGLPAHLISDLTVDTKTLLGKEGQVLEEKIHEAPGHSERAKLVCEFILRRLAQSKDVHRAIFTSIRQILFCSDVLSINVLADNCSLSRRQFERKFVHYAGYSPKQFHRIARFNAAIKGMGHQPTSLIEMAHRCGYYDQAHFIHDFRLFSGYTPKGFFEHQKGDANYRALEELDP